MSSSLGFEIFGPAARGAAVRSEILKSGEEFGIRASGARAYSTVSPETGWFASPTPAIYVGEMMKPYREWLPADGWESNLSIGGSFVSHEIENYYQRPWELGYGRLVKFDHEFIGRGALEAMADQPHREKVWLRWNTEDVLGVFRSMCHSGERYKYIDIPSAYYASLPFDKVLIGDRLIGLSQYLVYTVNAGCWFSLAIIDGPEARDGAEVTVVWGEGNDETTKPVVERHVQTEIRATVSTTSPGASR
jgi:glycine cleavage system aminomethyltransferase T